MDEQQFQSAESFYDQNKSTRTGCVNRVFLLGRIDQLPRSLVNTEQQQGVHFTLVTAETLQKKGVAIQQKEYHQVNVLSENLLRSAPKLQIGQLVYIEGKLCTYSYFGKQHEKQYKLVIIASRITILSSSAGS